MAYALAYGSSAAAIDFDARDCRLHRASGFTFSSLARSRALILVALLSASSAAALAGLQMLCYSTVGVASRCFGQLLVSFSFLPFSFLSFCMLSSLNASHLSLSLSLSLLLSPSFPSSSPAAILFLSLGGPFLQFLRRSVCDPRG